MSGTDQAFLYAETPTWHMTVATLLLIDPSTADGFDFESLKAHVAQRVRLIPQFRSRPVFVPLGVDRPGWVDEPQLDLSFHIRRVAVPAPGGPRELGELAGRLASYKLDRHKPLWEIWLIEGVQGGRVATLTKMHHATVDGISGVGLIDVLFDWAPGGPSLPVVRDVAEPGGDRVPGNLELLGTGLVNSAFRTPFRLARFTRQVLRQGLAAGASYRRWGATTAAPYTAPRTPFNGELTADRVLAYTDISLPRVKAMRQRFAVKLNDVVLYLCGTALRRYLLDLGSLPEQPLIAQCPVSVRAKLDRDDIGARIGSLFASLATDVADPVARLQTIHLSTQSAKEMQRAISAHQIMGLTDTTPPELIALAARAYAAAGVDRRGPPPVNLVISNVPGPQVPLRMNGALVQALYPMGPLLFGMGLNITVISYRDRLNCGVMSCPELMPDPQAVTDGLGAALTELEAQA